MDYDIDFINNTTERPQQELNSETTREAVIPERDLQQDHGTTNTVNRVISEKGDSRTSINLTSVSASSDSSQRSLPLKKRSSVAEDHNDTFASRIEGPHEAVYDETTNDAVKPDYNYPERDLQQDNGAPDTVNRVTSEKGDSRTSINLTSVSASISNSSQIDLQQVGHDTASTNRSISEGHISQTSINGTSLSSVAEGNLSPQISQESEQRRLASISNISAGAEPTSSEIWSQQAVQPSEISHSELRYQSDISPLAKQQSNDIQSSNFSDLSSSSRKSESSQQRAGYSGYSINRSQTSLPKEQSGQSITQLHANQSMASTGSTHMQKKKLSSRNSVASVGPTEPMHHSTFRTSNSGSRVDPNVDPIVLNDQAVSSNSIVSSEERFMNEMIPSYPSLVSNPSDSGIHVSTVAKSQSRRSNDMITATDIQDNNVVLTNTRGSANTLKSWSNGSSVMSQHAITPNKSNIGQEMSAENANSREQSELRYQSSVPDVSKKQSNDEQPSSFQNLSSSSQKSQLFQQGAGSSPSVKKSEEGYHQELKEASSNISGPRHPEHDVIQQEPLSNTGSQLNDSQMSLPSERSSRSRVQTPLNANHSMPSIERTWVKNPAYMSKQMLPSQSSVSSVSDSQQVHHSTSKMSNSGSRVDTNADPTVLNEEVSSNSIVSSEKRFENEILPSFTGLQPATQRRLDGYHPLNHSFLVSNPSDSGIQVSMVTESQPVRSSTMVADVQDNKVAPVKIGSVNSVKSRPSNSSSMISQHPITPDQSVSGVQPVKSRPSNTQQDVWYPITPDQSVTGVQPLANSFQSNQSIGSKKSVSWGPSDSVLSESASEFPADSSAISQRSTQQSVHTTQSTSSGQSSCQSEPQQVPSTSPNVTLTNFDQWLVNRNNVLDHIFGRLNNLETKTREYSNRNRRSRCNKSCEEHWSYVSNHLMHQSSLISNLEQSLTYASARIAVLEKNSQHMMRYSNELSYLIQEIYIRFKSFAESSPTKENFMKELQNISCKISLVRRQLDAMHNASNSNCIP